MRHTRSQPEDIRQVVDRVLRAAERRGLDNQRLAIAADIRADTLESYRITRARPQPAMMGADKYLRLVRALVEEEQRDLANHLIAPTGCELAECDPDTPNLHAVGAAAAGLAQEVLTSGADGKFCHRDKARIREKAAAIIPMLHDVTGQEPGQDSSHEAG